MVFRIDSDRDMSRGIPLLLIAAATIASFWFACVTPLPALAVVAAYTLAPRTALLAVTGAWLANQAVGYGFLDYPGDANTILSGIMVGAAAVAATALAGVTMRRASPNAAVALATGFVVAYAAYETLLFLTSFVFGGRDGFTPSIVGEFALLNLAWTVGLVGTLEIWRYGRAIVKGAAIPAP